MQLHTLPVRRLGELLERKEVSSEELTSAFLKRINEMEDKINAYITVAREEEALAQARSIDRKRGQGERLSPLAGIPVAISDNICTKGIKTTCASKMLEGFIPPYDASVLERLKEAGAIIAGKCNLDEFGMGASTENSAFLTTKNPLDPGAVPGGSCGGAAAAVAAGEAAFALGSDTGGSIRQPAAFCGVVGLKPTYGRVSRYGLISHAPSLDQIGPFAREVADLAPILGIICGRDDRDASSTSVSLTAVKEDRAGNVKGLRVGLPREYFGADLAPQVAAKLQEAVRKLEELGAVCEEVSMPHTEYALPAHYLISSAEASSNLARYDGVRYGLRVDAADVQNMFRKTRGEGFGDEVKKRIMLGTYALSTGNYKECYVKALQLRTLVKEDFARAWEDFDCLLTPVSPSTAFEIGEKAKDSLAMYLSHSFTIPANLAGLPAMSLPFGLVGGLPVGLQLIARHFDEGMLLKVGHALEQSLK
ncbi:MAG: Glutamyl-tRNA(Gln) amidotransferase subunit A [Firmicutes bacterium ADurb.Bin456]|nr:MAG: Glutamyl-tRNA(Gln) amidotransferase subunit A [Firmicutes bacterium ADurb.Bin456]